MTTLRHLAPMALVLALVQPGTGAQAQPTSRPETPASRPAEAPPLTPEHLEERGVRRAGELVRVPDVRYGQAPGRDGSPVDLLMDVTFPARPSAPLPAVVYVHGGSWSGGAKTDAAMFSPIFAAGGYVTVAISYRLTAEASYPAAVHDVKTAVRFLRANAETLGIDPERIGIWGHSAGAQLALLVATSANATGPDAAALKGGPSDVSSAVKCAVSLAGPMDLTTPAALGQRAVRSWLGGRRADVAERARVASPITWVDDEDPPMLLLHGTADRLVGSAQSEAFHAAVRAAGGASELLLLDGERHVITDPAAYIRIAAFFDLHLGGAARTGMEQYYRAQGR